jgi:cold shock CspA family protein
VVQRDQGLWVHPAGRRWRQGVFVHISAVERAGLSSLPEGAKISYDIVPNKGKESADLRVT